VRVRGWIWIAVVVVTSTSLRAADHSVDPIVSRIQRETVDSSALAAVGYSKRLRALEIEFHDGLIYRYLDVPGSIYTDMMHAESKAHFYNQNVRGKFHCLRVRRPMVR
jgi:hypothetical protein